MKNAKTDLAKDIKEQLFTNKGRGKLWKNFSSRYKTPEGKRKSMGSLLWQGTKDFWPLMFMPLIGPTGVAFKFIRSGLGKELSKALFGDKGPGDILLNAAKNSGKLKTVKNIKKTFAPKNIAGKARAFTDEHLFNTTSFVENLLKLKQNPKQFMADKYKEFRYSSKEAMERLKYNIGWHTLTKVPAETLANSFATANQIEYMIKRTAKTAWKWVAEKPTDITHLAEMLKNIFYGPNIAKKLATGGAISGVGGPREDRVPIMASAGEYILKADAAKNIGYDTLNHMNSTGKVPKFADGGQISEQDKKIAELQNFVDKYKSELPAEQELKEEKNSVFTVLKEKAAAGLGDAFSGMATGINKLRGRASTEGETMSAAEIARRLEERNKAMQQQAGYAEGGAVDKDKLVAMRASINEMTNPFKSKSTEDILSENKNYQGTISQGPGKLDKLHDFIGDMLPFADMDRKRANAGPEGTPELTEFMNAVSYAVPSGETGAGMGVGKKLMSLAERFMANFKKPLFESAQGIVDYFSKDVIKAMIPNKGITGVAYPMGDAMKKFGSTKANMELLGKASNMFTRQMERVPEGFVGMEQQMAIAQTRQGVSEAAEALLRKGTSIEEKTRVKDIVSAYMKEANKPTSLDQMLNKENVVQGDLLWRAKKLGVEEPLLDQLSNVRRIINSKADLAAFDLGGDKVLQLQASSLENLPKGVSGINYPHQVTNYGNGDLQLSAGIFPKLDKSKTTWGHVAELKKELAKQGIVWERPDINAVGFNPEGKLVTDVTDPRLFSKYAEGGLVTGYAGGGLVNKIPSKNEISKTIGNKFLTYKGPQDKPIEKNPLIDPTTLLATAGGLAVGGIKFGASAGISLFSRLFGASGASATEKITDTATAKIKQLKDSASIYGGGSGGGAGAGREFGYNTLDFSKSSGAKLNFSASTKEALNQILGQTGLPNGMDDVLSEIAQGGTNLFKEGLGYADGGAVKAKTREEKIAELQATVDKYKAYLPEDKSIEKPSVFSKIMDKIKLVVETVQANKAAATEVYDRNIHNAAASRVAYINEMREAQGLEPLGKKKGDIPA
ncbi:MAG: hypothetical protein EHM12_10965, partial [Dehalococcoidia bacterium]